MHIQTLTVEQSFASLHTSAAGLTASEARRRLAEFGPNRVEEARRESMLLRFAREFTHFFAVILVNGVFSFWQEYKAERAVDALCLLLPQQATLSRDGEVVPGDIVLLEEGDFVPADCRVVEAFGLRVNTATITGESLPAARSADPHPESSPLFATT